VGVPLCDEEPVRVCDDNGVPLSDDSCMPVCVSLGVCVVDAVWLALGEPVRELDAEPVAVADGMLDVVGEPLSEHEAEVVAVTDIEADSLVLPNGVPVWLPLLVGLVEPVPVGDIVPVLDALRNVSTPSPRNVKRATTASGTSSPDIASQITDSYKPLT
jgi:hypothetical protein